ncbi:hypothetical protein, partial [Ruegeria atlantica]|uniref:hypothetical protein n=1 Tax=Ruegeria atlantica TaxID=81569 RepID=UPI001C2BD48C
MRLHTHICGTCCLGSIKTRWFKPVDLLNSPRNLGVTLRQNTAKVAVNATIFDKVSGKVSAMTELKRTPLYDLHVELGG